MCSCVLLSPGRFGPLRAEVVVGFRRVRLVQALLSSPSSAGLVPFSVGLRFSFPLPFQGCPFWARFHVLVFALSLFFCVPLFASWLSNFHLIVIFTSFSFPFFFIFISLSGPQLPKQPRGSEACVWTIWKDVKLLNILYKAGGSGRSFGTATNEDTHLIWWYRLGRQSAYVHQFFISVNGNRPSQEPARRYFPLEGCLLHCCRNLDLFGYLQLVQLHQNLPQSKDVESLLRTEIHAGSTNFFLAVCKGLFCARVMHSTTKFAMLFLSKCVWVKASVCKSVCV